MAWALAVGAGAGTSFVGQVINSVVDAVVGAVEWTVRTLLDMAVERPWDLAALMTLAVCMYYVNPR